MQINALAGKVSALKDISIQIGGHIKEDNRLLDDMGGSFDNASSLLGGTMKRLGNLSKSGGSGLVASAAFLDSGTHVSCRPGCTHGLSF